MRPFSLKRRCLFTLFSIASGLSARKKPRLPGTAPHAFAGRKGDMTAGSPLRLILSFTGPLLFGFLFQQLYSFVDASIVGRTLGSQALAAVGATGSLNFMVLGLCTGICSGFAIPVAQAFGAGEDTQVRRYTANAVWLCAALSVIMSVVTGLCCRTFLRWMNTPADILDGACDYLSLIFWGIPSIILYNMSGSILRSLGDSRTPVLFLVLASLINIGLDLLLILGLGMGVMGAALATVISQLVSGLGCVLAMRRRFPILHFEAGDLKWRPLYASRLIRIGLPMGLQFSITAVGSVVVQTAVNVLGTAYVAAVTAADKLGMFFTCVLEALGSTMATYTGQNVGACRIDRIREGVRAAGLIGTVYCAAAFLTLLFFGKPMLGLFISAEEAEVTASAALFLHRSAAFYVPLMLIFLLRLTIQGAGYTPLAVCAGICEMIARTAVGALLIPTLGFDAACFASPAAWIAADLFLYPAYRYTVRSLRTRLQPAA